jgi:DNA repair protein RecO (recombination protein O)
VSLVTVPALLLRSYPYSESSRILRLLTPTYGIVSVVAKGVRRRSSRGETPLDTFLEGDLTFRYRADRDLHTLRDFQARRRNRGLGGDMVRFGGASLLAELILDHTLQEENPRLYEWVVHTLEALSTDPDEVVPGRILAGAWGILSQFGFPPEMARCVRCGRPMSGDEEGIARFDFSAGGLRCPACAEEGAGPRVGPIARRDLRALLAGDAPAPLLGARAHLLLVERYALHHLAGGKPFRSAELLRPFLTSGDEPGAGDEGGESS